MLVKGAPGFHHASSVASCVCEYVERLKQRQRSCRQRPPQNGKAWPHTSLLTHKSFAMDPQNAPSGCNIDTTSVVMINPQWWQRGPTGPQCGSKSIFGGCNSVTKRLTRFLLCKNLFFIVDTPSAMINTNGYCHYIINQYAVENLSKSDRTSLLKECHNPHKVRTLVSTIRIPNEIMYCCDIEYASNLLTLNGFAPKTGFFYILWKVYIHYKCSLYTVLLSPSQLFCNVWF